MKMNHIQVRTCTSEDYALLTGLIEPIRYIYGIDTVETGWKKRHLELLKTWLVADNAHVVGAFDGDVPVGFCAQTFSTTGRWLLNLCYISEQAGKNQFNASKVGGPMVDALIVEAERRGLYEFFYCVRDAGRRRLDMTLESTQLAINNYVIEDLEILPPMTPSKHPRIAEAILGMVNGRNKKTVVVRRGYRKNE